MEHFDDRVVEALWKLTIAERAVLLLRAIGDFSYHEIHEILSIPLGSVVGYMSRSRTKLRQSLAEYATQHRLCRHFGKPQP